MVTEFLSPFFLICKGVNEMNKKFKAALYSLKYNIKNTLLIMIITIAFYYASAGDTIVIWSNILIVFTVLMISGKNFQMQYNGKFKVKIPYLIIPISASIGITMFEILSFPKLDSFIINMIIMFVFTEVILLIYDMASAN